jgi:hypothetical protein
MRSKVAKTIRRAAREATKEMPTAVESVQKAMKKDYKQLTRTDKQIINRRKYE